MNSSLIADRAEQALVAFSHDSLQHAVEWVEFHRRLAREIVPNDPESIWRWSWLPWSYDVSGAALVIDAAHDTLVSPVFVHLKTDLGNVPVIAPSMGTLVRWWLELFDVGAAVYDRHAGRWRHDLARVPDHYDRRLT